MMEKNLNYPNFESCDPRLCISSKMRKCNRIISQVFRKYIAPFDLTDSQLSILFVVGKKSVVTQTELSNILYLEKSTISRNMRRLFENGYIVKLDKKQIEITEDGLTLLEVVVPEWEKAMAEAKSILQEEGLGALDTVFAQLQQ